MTQFDTCRKNSSWSEMGGHISSFNFDKTYQKPHSLHRGWFKKIRELIFLLREFYASSPTLQNFEVQVCSDAFGDIHRAGSMYI